MDAVHARLQADARPQQRIALHGQLAARDPRLVRGQLGGVVAQRGLVGA